jgi:hypothetical protein
MKFATGLATLSVVIAAALAPGQARAADETEVFSANAVARCQATTPQSEAQLRRRPLSLVNEGTTNAFVSCSFETEVAESLAQSVEVWAHNQGAADASVTCTGINGYQYLPGGNEFLPQTLVVAAGAQSDEPFAFVDSDFAAGSAGIINVSCVLPPGTGIDDTYAAYLINDADTAPAQ